MSMNIERDELARDIFLADNSNGAEAQMLEDWKALCLLGGGYTYAHNTADGLIAKGYRKPHTITTVEELDALPDGTVLKSRFGELLELADGSWHFGDVGGSNDPSLPATVLYAPDMAH